MAGEVGAIWPPSSTRSPAAASAGLSAPASANLLERLREADGGPGATIGAVSDTIQAVGLCREAGVRYVISHRSGETEDAFMADFAVALGAAKSRAAPLAAASASPNTTGCCRSKGKWEQEACSDRRAG
ncbi:hypothetical protein MPC4_280016 [Methylocella tundrae]|uniref:Enolase n=1 Tax=Methylocella tundrae TaxID=227605 RepID=A0A8B6M774_METTU|nr:hypothetical protein MPC1_3320003 [Methylocella tundrae]VTZ50720.1 hypothetical protein MPC4_280016 [Methylocella tundrae]